MVDLDPIQGGGSRRCGAIDRLGFGMDLAPLAAFGQRQSVQPAADRALRGGMEPLLKGPLTNRPHHLGGKPFLGREVEFLNQAAHQVFARPGQTPPPAPATGATHPQGGQRTVSGAQSLDQPICVPLG
jgi:hypothetical protein